MPYKKERTCKKRKISLKKRKDPLKKIKKKHPKKVKRICVFRFVLPTDVVRSKIKLFI